MRLDLRGRGAGWGLYLHHRLEQLVGDGVVQLSRQPAHDLLDLLDEFPRGRVHDGELLLDPEGVVRTAFLELYGYGVPPLSSGLTGSGSLTGDYSLNVGQHSTRFESALQHLSTPPDGGSQHFSRVVGLLRDSGEPPKHAPR